MTPAQFGDAIPSSNADLCTRFTKWLNVPQLLRDLFSWMLTSDGAISEEFKAEVATFVMPTGVIVYSATLNMGTGFLLCNGQAVSRTTYAALFTAIGTRYGDGDASTTFNLPDLQGRSPIGAGTGSGLTFRDINSPNVGEEDHVQTEAELVAHTHTWDGPTTRTEERGGGANVCWRGTDPTQVTASTGGGVGFNVVHPCVVLHPFIKT